ncbi:MAG: toll/interleukin-1 receptor domain-containing protein [Ferruginibacter sp.]
MNRVIEDQSDWDELLGYISSRKLTPVIGKEMYTFSDNGSTLSIENYLAKQLLERSRITDSPDLSLPDTVDFLEFEKHIKPKDIKNKLMSIEEGIAFEFPLLADFLQIKDLNYYINTGVYNSILEKQIKAVRNEHPTAINFSLNEPFSDSSSLDKLTEPFVFNVFGSLKQNNDPAVGEDDMLEYAGNFKEKISAAINISNALKNRNLLFLGCNFPEWMMHFTLRLLSNEPLHEWGDNRTIIIVNDNTEYRKKLIDRLKNYDVTTYEGSTSDFVKELTRQWQQKNPQEETKKNVFLSYTRADTAIVENVKKSLEEMGGVNCWYDKRELEPGDNWLEKIVVSIRRADFFIPIISENSLQHKDGYVHKEWVQAQTEWVFRNSGKSSGNYLIPVVVDDSDANGNSIADFFDNNINRIKIPGGIPDNDFLNKIKATLNRVS